MTSRGLVRGVAALLLGALVAAGWAAPRAEAAWLRAETQHFVLYSDGSESNLRELAADLEDFDALLRSAHGLDPAAAPARKLDIYLVTGPHELARVMPGAGKSLTGVYRANLGDIYAVAIRGGQRSAGGRQLLFHEYVHHFMLQNFHAAYPAWLVEGYAEYFGATRIEPDRIEVGVVPPGRARALVNTSWLPLQDVAGLAPPRGQPRDVGVYYAQSWLLTHYMLSDPQRKRRLEEYLAAIGRGEDPVVAMRAALGMDFSAAQTALETYLRAAPGIRYMRTARPAAVVAISALGPSADALLLEGQRLKSGVRAPDRPAVLKLIRERAARFPDDRLAQLVLARAEITFGDRAAGEAILSRRIAVDGHDVDALWLMGLSRLFAGQADPGRRAALYAEAAPWLDRAAAIDPDRYQVLFDIAQSRSAAPGPPTDDTVALLLRAHALAPQVAPVTLAAARALMATRRFELAEALLAPLANNPHGGGTAAAAQRLIGRARRGQQAEPAGAAEPEDAEPPAPG